MLRREFIAGLGSAAAWPVAVGAQRPAVPTTVRWNDVPRGTMDEVRSHVRLDLPFI
jgi:hypothetical protein